MNDTKDKKNTDENDEIKSQRTIDEVVVTASYTEGAKEYRERVEDLNYVLGVRNPILEKFNVMSGVAQDTLTSMEAYDKYEDKINGILAKYGMTIEDFDEQKISEKDKKKIEKFFKKGVQTLGESASDLVDEKKLIKKSKKQIKELEKKIKKYEKNHHLAREMRLQEQHANALKVMLLEDKDSYAYKQAKHVDEEYQKLYKNGKYFSHHNIVVEPMSDEKSGFYDGKYIHIQEPKLNEYGFLTKDPVERGDPVATNRVLVHEAGHKKDSEYAGMYNFCFREHVIMADRLTENLSKASEYLYVAEQWMLCKNNGMKYYEYEDASGGSTKVKVDDMLNQCPGLKEAIGKSGFNPENAADVKKVVEAAGKHWNETYKDAYMHQGLQNAMQVKSEAAVMLQGVEIMGKQNQYYNEVEKRMLSNVHNLYRTYDLTPYKDLLNPMTQKEALAELPPDFKVQTADLMEKVNKYLDDKGVRNEDKDAYYLVALSKMIDIKRPDVSQSLDANITQGVYGILVANKTLTNLKEDLARQSGEAVVNPKAQSQDMRIDKKYRKKQQAQKNDKVEKRETTNNNAQINPVMQNEHVRD